MPILKSTYKPPFLYRNKHLQTIIPANFRKIKSIKYKCERINTPDNDFLDLDWSLITSDKLAIVLHGYEGHSYRDHILGMIKIFNKSGWDGVAMNQRGCSGIPNLLAKSYHGGSSDDLAFVVNCILKKNRYKEIALIGFSLGGNIVLKYLGEMGTDLPEVLKKAACISVPCDLKTTAARVSKNPIYYNYFLSKLYKKIMDKTKTMPAQISMIDFKKIKNLSDYDELYTAPQNGFRDADDYYQKCSCKKFLMSITIPTLIINAKDDPFLTELSYPVKEAESSKNIFLEIPDYGGHTGFVSFNKDDEYYTEKRVQEFILAK